MNLDAKKQLATEWFTKLRDSICQVFEEIERERSSKACFQSSRWGRPGGGGGQMSIMRGNIFEKVGVNISTVYGKFDDKFAKEIPGTDGNTDFWASGISLVAHMVSPYVPAVHMNTRMIVTQNLWFGGGADLTPTYIDTQDTAFFHRSLKEACDKYSHEYYPKFKKLCDEYFYLPHRKESRGVGGIFYDNLNSGDWHEDFAFTQEIGKTFLSTYQSLVRRHYNKSWTEQEKEVQLIKRSRYVEFNLLYDRGTRFGIMTNGSPDAILMSMPPQVKWP